MRRSRFGATPTPRSQELSADRPVRLDRFFSGRRPARRRTGWEMGPRRVGALRVRGRDADGWAGAPAEVGPQRGRGGVGASGGLAEVGIRGSRAHGCGDTGRRAGSGCRLRCGHGAPAAEPSSGEVVVVTTGRVRAMQGVGLRGQPRNHGRADEHLCLTRFAGATRRLRRRARSAARGPHAHACARPRDELLASSLEGSRSRVCLQARRSKHRVLQTCTSPQRAPVVELPCSATGSRVSPITS